MPPKRKVLVKNKKVPPKKKLKDEIQTIKAVLTKGPSFRKRIFKIDKGAGNQFIGGQVVDDFDCMLNQTNIDGNNNKYYLLQMILHNGKYFVWARWGRVGESGQSLKLGPFNTQDEGEESFSKRFNDKTKNDWKNRNEFKAVKGKYTLLEMGIDDEVDTPDPSLLDVDTQFLIDLIWDTEMFNDALIQLKLDINKCPLGNLNQLQFSKGFEILEELENAITNNETKSISQLSSIFYDIIPHDFAQSSPPPISTVCQVREKRNMLLVLMDIESTQALLIAPMKKKQWQLNQHPLDDKYDRLDIGLIPLDRDGDEFKVIEEYIDNTKMRPVTIVNVWQVFRRPEYKRFKMHQGLANRKLLWYGTNVAATAAILKSGLRIVPHSGGRVGKGIYLRSENGASSQDVQCNRSNLGVMFLNEVALGHEMHVFDDDPSIVEPPRGYQSVVAQGKTEPDPMFDKHITLDKKKIVVPVGKPIERDFRTGFSQSEYVIYKESQSCIRYMLLCQF